MKKIDQIFKYSLVLGLIAGMMIFTSCESEEPDPENKEPNASFQFAVSTDNWAEVSFTDFSSNAVSYSWDFGDNAGTSVEQNPTYTFSAGGTYTVTLTVTGEDGTTDEFSDDVPVTDPLEAQRTLFGESGKTWMLVAAYPEAEVFPYEVGPVDGSAFWWALGPNEDLCVRECIFDDTWVFNPDGTFVFDNHGDFWGDGPFQEGVANTCFDATVADNWVGAGGEDLSGWDSGTHGFVYDPAAATLAIDGGFIGIPKAHNTGEVLTPQSSTTYDIVKLVDADVDTLVIRVEFTNADNVEVFWESTLVSYDNPSDVVEVDDCAPVENVNVTFNVNMSSYSSAFTTVFVSGSYNGWGGSTALSDDDGDDVWSATIEVAANGTFEYKFHLDEWTVQESLTDGSSCTVTTIDGENTYINRSLVTATSAVNVATVCWESCADCEFSMVLDDLVGTSWSLFEGAGAVWVGNEGISSANWWTSDAAWAEGAPCLFDDTFTFGADGAFTVAVGDAIFVEERMTGVSATGCMEVANVPADISAWAGGDFSFTFAERTATDLPKITVTGEGAYIGFYKGANGTEPVAPSDGSITYEVVSFSENSMIIGVDIANDGMSYWTYKLVKNN